jgi:hypothetical protein
MACGMAQVVEGLFSKYEALSSNSNTMKNKKEFSCLDIDLIFKDKFCQGTSIPPFLLHFFPFQLLKRNPDCFCIDSEHILS